MTVQRWNRAAIALLALSWMLCTSVPALAQTAVSSGDIQRLQDEVYQASADVSRLRTTDALQAGRLQDDLDRLREDVIYLKVKLRKESRVSRSEYDQVRDELLELRSRARGETRPPTSVGNGPTSTGVSGGSSGSAPVYDDRPRATTTRAGQSGIPVGPGNRRADSDGADVGHRSSRGSVRGDDRGGSVSRRSRALSRPAR